MWVISSSKVLLLCLSVLTVSCGWFVYKSDSSYSLTTESPDRTYKVVLKQETGTGKVNPAREAEARIGFNVTKGGTSIVSKELLYSGDSLDMPFETLYPQHSWVSESVLRFGEELPGFKAQHDEIKVHNQTNRSLTYLRVNSGKYEMFLLFELKPNSTVILPTRAQPSVESDLSWISSVGKFEHGVPLKEEGKNFYIRGKYNGPAHYSILIREDGITILSEEFEALSEKTRT